MIDELLSGFDATKFYSGELLERLMRLNHAAEYIQMSKDMETRFMGLSRKLKGTYGICFPYDDDKCVVLAGKIKELADDKAQFADWSTRDDIKNQLNMELTVLLYKNGYPPEWDEEVFEKVMEQAENFRRYSS
ncbi:MAG: DUF3387 domain-containing protein [Clostridiales bacterium]|nr:DUF3387 domain-containing protein [Clostridiales bacterium]